MTSASLPSCLPPGRRGPGPGGKRGARLVCLETSSQGGYQRTRRFYDQCGYLEESRLRDFYKPGDDRITYVKRFSADKES